MISSLRLEDFKNFRDAELQLGNLTLLVGTNASGKSNLRDAFRFLHGISRGYTLAETIGEKYVGGSPEWLGIRGGTREVAYFGSSEFTLTAHLNVKRFGRRVLAARDRSRRPKVIPRVSRIPYKYSITISVEDNGKPPRVVRESLWMRSDEMVFDSDPADNPPSNRKRHLLTVRLPRNRKQRILGPKLDFVSTQPALTQITDNEEAPAAAIAAANDVLKSLRSMRFLDLSVAAMRNPSVPGQDVLGDRGENLSSVLQAICEVEPTKKSMLEWIRQLTPLDVVDFEFVTDQTGRVLVSLVEADGTTTSAYSASDGTLRFLAMIAALLGPKPARFYFFEELENGIHPTRLSLLLELIESRVGDGEIQMVATTHSPQLLAFMSEESREAASLVYRHEDEKEAHITRIVDIPEARRVLENRNLGRLHESGWLENAVSFAQPAGIDE